MRGRRHPKAEQNSRMMLLLLLKLSLLMQNPWPFRSLQSPPPLLSCSCRAMCVCEAWSYDDFLLGRQ